MTTEAQKNASKKYYEANKQKIYEKRKEYLKEYSKAKYKKISADEELKANYNAYYKNLYKKKKEDNNELNLFSLVL